MFHFLIDTRLLAEMPEPLVFNCLITAINYAKTESQDTGGTVYLAVADETGRILWENWK